MKPERIGRRNYALGCLLVDGGLRISEACGLTWADVSLSEGLLHVRGPLAPLRAGHTPEIVPPKSQRGYRTMALTPRACGRLWRTCTRARMTPRSCFAPVTR